MKAKTGPEFFRTIERASKAIDLWPDWMLDQATLIVRKQRRDCGEILPIDPNNSEEDTLP